MHRHLATRTYRTFVHAVLQQLCLSLIVNLDHRTDVGRVAVRLDLELYKPTLTAISCLQGIAIKARTTTIDRTYVRIVD